MADGGSDGKGRPEIPDRLFFRIGDVSQIVGVETHVLRYWESEFPSFVPRKTPSGQRQYRRKDVEMALAIKELLYGKRYTIEGARKALRSGGKVAALDAGASRPPEQAPDQREALGEIRSKLQQILDLLAP